jgi:biopolymer transport protein ExbD
MAELLTKSTDKRKKALRVDLTPMVDLGFLLITFFIFTTTMSAETAVKLLLPADSKDSTLVGATGAVTIIPTSARITVYSGDNWQQAVSFTPADVAGIRHHLLQTKQELIQHFGNDDKMFVLLKPHASSNLGQLIDLFDELKICGIKRYSLSELSEHESDLVQQ